MEIKYIGRVLPSTGKQHQNQEVASSGGIMWSLKSTDYKGVPKVLVRYGNKTDNDNAKYVRA